MILLLELLAVAVLLLLNAFFVAAEYGLVTARRTRLRELEEAGSRRARAALAITSNPPRFIAAMQLGVTATSLAIGAIGEPVLARVFDPVLAGVIAFGIAFLLITYLHVVVGELVPKGLALGHSETTALAVSGPVRAFFMLLNPLIWLLQRSSDFALRALGLEPPAGDEDVHSEAELKMLLSRSAEHGELQADEQEMLYKVFDFADKEVSDVMVPRPEVVALSVDLPPEECLAAVIDSASSMSATSSRPSTTAVCKPSASTSSSARRRWFRRRRIWRRCSRSSAARTSTWRSSSTSTAPWRAS